MQLLTQMNVMIGFISMGSVELRGTIALQVAEIDLFAKHVTIKVGIQPPHPPTNKCHIACLLHK